MAYLVCDKDRTLVLFSEKPDRVENPPEWYSKKGSYEILRQNMAFSLIGRELTWNDEPVEIGEIKQIEQTELEALGTDNRAEFWKACVLHVDQISSSLHHIEFADKMLEEYDKRFGSQISVNTEVFRIPDEELEEYLK